MAEKVPIGSAMPFRFNCIFLHSPFFSISFMRLHFGWMAKIDHLVKDGYTIWNKIGHHPLQTVPSTDLNFTQHTCMNAKGCGHHCVFVCIPNLSAWVYLRGENLYGGRELVDMWLLLGFQRIRPLKRNDQCIESHGDLSVAPVLGYRTAQNLRSIGRSEFK